MSEPTKAVCQCVCCSAWFPFVLPGFDSDLNGPVCADCKTVLFIAKFEMAKQNIKQCRKAQPK